MSTEKLEPAEFGVVVRRFVRAYGRRVAEWDAYDLKGLVDLHDDVDRAIVVAVTGLRTGPGRYSWTEIGKALGISRQAARQRFAPHLSS